MKNILYVLAVLFLGIGACKKDNYVDPRVQFGKDTVIINQFIEENNIDAVKDPYGIYYQIIELGVGDTIPNDYSKITVQYTGRLLNGAVFDKTENDATYSEYLGNLIGGWRLGIPKIRRGGKIRLIIPSGYGYGDVAKPGIPANSVLDFDIELLKVE